MSRRNRGSGSIIKRGRYFYLRLRSGSTEKNVPLTDTHGQAVTDERGASIAAARLSNITESRSLEELAAFVKIVKLQFTRQIRLEDAFYHVIGTYSVSESSVAVYKGIVSEFIAWVQQSFPYIKYTYDLTPSTGQLFVNHLQNDKHQKNTTINNKITTLRSFFKRLDSTQTNPFTSIKRLLENPSNRQPLSLEQVQTVLDVMDECKVTGHLPGKSSHGPRIRNIDAHRIIFLMCAYTGMRISDAFYLEWSGVDLVNDKIHYVPIKTERHDPDRKGVTVPLYPILKKELLAQQSRQGSNEPRVVGHEMASRSLRDVNSALNRYIHAALNDSPLKSNSGRREYHYSMHSLRHGFISNGINNGVPDGVMADMVGHKSLKMTRRYTHIYDSSKREAINKIFGNSTATHDATDKREELLGKLSLLPSGVVDLLLKAVSTQGQ